MRTLLIGKGYWGSIVQQKLKNQTQLLYVANSKDDIDEILNKYEIDYVFICTPTNTHYEIVKKCINHRINIFCEKPFTGDIIKAQELYDMSEKNGVKLFVDNIFLYRNEFISIQNKLFTNIKFIWNKYEEEFKENLFNTLLYHDLYLLLYLSNNDWDVNFCNISDEKLFVSLISNNLKSEFIYDRTYLGNKEKKILIDDKCVDFSKPLNDPLFNIINDLKTNNINFTENKKITLKTINLLTMFQNESLLHTSRHIK